MSDPRVPPRQIVTRKFPVIGEREPEPFDRATWTLEIDGLVTTPLALSFDELSDLPRVVWDDDIHCVTRWSRLGVRWEGVPVADLLDRAGVSAEARFVRFASGRGHDTSLPLELARADALIALGLDLGDGIAPVPPGHGGPVRSITRHRYFYKSVKWLRRIELLAEDRLGFWERTGGYHNNADPWTEQRYVARGLSRAELTARLAARDLADQELIGADLTGVDLSRVDLRRANLRGAVLRGAVLRGARLAGANLTNAILVGADLSGADLDGVDLEGADLREADLRGAKGAPSALMAAQFVSGPGAADGANVAGLDWSDAPLAGLLEDQEAFLRERDVIP